MSKVLIISSVAQGVIVAGLLGTLLLRSTPSTKAAADASSEHGEVAHQSDHQTSPDEHRQPAKKKEHSSEKSASGDHGSGPDSSAESTAQGGHGTSTEAHSASDKSDHRTDVKPMGASEAAANLLAGNTRFVNGTLISRSLGEERRRVQNGQHPRAMVLCCSDSRVPPEMIFDQGLGDLFVVRTAGNVADPVAVGSLEYAAEHLHSRLLVVLGHERCGAVTAAVGGEKAPTKNLEAVIKKISPAVEASKGWATGSGLIHLAVETNVSRTADDLLRQSPILRKLVSEGKLTILRAMYDLDSGKVRPLP